MQLKRDANIPLGTVIDRVIEETDVEPEAFRAFVGRYATMILSTVKRGNVGEP